MFQSVRPNSQIFVFHKGDNPRLEIGYVSSQPVARPKYQVPPTFGQPQEMVVDLNVKINGPIVNFTNIPAQTDISDSFSNGESIVISDSKEAMNAEILSLKQKSIDIINSVDFHKNLISNCDVILSELNPEFAEKQAQKNEIDLLKSKMDEMTKNLNEIMETNRLLVGRLSKND